MTSGLLTLTYAAGVQVWDTSSLRCVEEVLNLRIPLPLPWNAAKKDIGDEVLMLCMQETDPTSEAADHGNGDQGVDVYDDCDIPLAAVLDRLLSGLIAPNFTIDAQGGITRLGDAEASDADEEELDVLA
ncbi:hypothetical protein B0H14DRAFT_3472109 [Mycena olivaceomarginata]|nr:hypothetical protein B0H14DRAFT_3472109 [Mycena olivaceomarginata]